MALAAVGFFKADSGVELSGFCAGVRSLLVLNTCFKCRFYSQLKRTEK